MYKGRIKKKPLSKEVRPVGARALKSAIDTLRPWISGALVLDLFCGQGRFGLESLKEGAKEVHFVDLNSRQIQEIQEQVAKFNFAAMLRAEDAFTYLKEAEARATQYDLIFIDPPFPLWNDEFAAKLLKACARVVAPGSILLVKYPARMVASLPVSAASLTVWKTALFGESKLLYFKCSELQKVTDAGARLES